VLCVGYVRCEDAGGADAKGKYDIAVFDDTTVCEEAKEDLIAARDEYATRPTSSSSSPRSRGRLTMCQRV
jgi:hypothetical protein